MSAAKAREVDREGKEKFPLLPVNEILLSYEPV